MNESTDRRYSRARQYLSDGNLDAARISLESLLLRNPAHTQAHLKLSDIAWEEDRVRDATRHALNAARALPDDPELIVAVAGCLMRIGEVVAARTCLEHPALASTRSIPVLLRMAGQRHELNENAEALRQYDRAIAAGADGPDLRFQRGMQLIFNGLLKDGEEQLLECLRLDPGCARAWQELSRLHRQTPQDNHLATLAESLRSVEPSSYEHACIEFARYKELEDLGRYDEAWEALARGNALMYARRNHNPAIMRQLFADLTAVCTADLVRPAEVVQAGAQPIFIIGMQRSGTTLVDRMLGNHSQIASGGELDDFDRQLRWISDHGTTLDASVIQRLPSLDYADLGRRYLKQTQWRANGKPFYTDKLPRNWMTAGLIRRALPQARILHMVRDPMDVCFSNYRALFADSFTHIYDLNALASYYVVYRRTLAHWHTVMPGHILDIPYADLVRDAEGTLRKVLAFCGLPWEPGCADLTRNRGAVATLSAAQVREPIHARSVDSWRRYERQLSGLQQMLAG